MKWFISLIMFSILPILYFFVQNQASPKKNLILSVTLPYSLPLILLLGASLPCFTAARGILPLIDTLIRKE